jgi:hypothetical protein
MRLFRHWTPFRRIFGDTSGDTLHLYPVPRFATLCETLIPCKSLICRTLCGQHAPTCKPLQLWKKLTQNPRAARPWGFNSPSRHQSRKQLPLNQWYSVRQLLFIDMLDEPKQVQGRNSGTPTRTRCMSFVCNVNRSGEARFRADITYDWLS